MVGRDSGLAAVRRHLLAARVQSKKVLVSVVHAADWARMMKGNGVAFNELTIDWADLMAFKRSFTDPITPWIERSLARQGIEAIHGAARFSGPNSLTVNGDEIEARHVLIATGAAPARLNIPGEEHVVSSDHFLDLESLPRRIAMLGGGFISFEFAHIAARAGADVSIVHRGKRPLNRFDPDLVDILLERTRKLDIKLVLETEVSGVERIESGFTVRGTKDGETVSVEADLVVHGAGRPANLDSLNLEAAGVEFDRTGVMVNEYLQSVSNESIFAAGDAAASGTPPLTPMAELEGVVAGSNMIHGNTRTADGGGVPSVVFTIPALAMVGLTEREAREQGLDFEVNYSDTSSWMGPMRAAEPASGHKVLIDRETRKILGAHLIGHSADEVINVFALAMRNGLTAEQIEETIFAYPTMFSDVEFMVA